MKGWFRTISISCFSGVRHGGGFRALRVEALKGFGFWLLAYGVVFMLLLSVCGRANSMPTPPILLSIPVTGYIEHDLTLNLT